MSTERGNRSKRYPLHVTIAFAFTAVLLLVGLVLISFNYNESRKIALLSADDLLERTSAHLQTNIEKLYGPVQNLVDVASRALSPEAVTLAQRLDSLAFLAEPFHLNDTVSSVFIGYDNGDFFLLRPLRGQTQARQAVAAPAAAAFVVQSIERLTAAETIEQLLFFNESLELIEERTLQWSGFDPRQREWYANAMTSTELVPSGFYVFFTTREVGITFARQLAGGGAVVGADLALGDLEEGLAQQRVTPSSKIGILDSGGNVIALSDPQREVPLIGDPDDGQVRMPHVTDLQDPVYQQLGELFDTGADSGRYSLSVDGRAWLASFSALPTRSGNKIFLAVLIPRDELLSDVARVRNHSVVISLALLIAAVALVFAVARHISGSLNALAQEAEAVREFKLETPITVRSRISEVDDLAATMAVMKSSLQQFLAISHALSAEKDYRQLLEMILAESRNVSKADGGAILLRSDDEKSLRIAILENSATGADYGGTAGQEAPFGPVELDVDSPDTSPDIDCRVALAGTLARIDDIDAEPRYDYQHLQERFDTDGYQTRSLLSVPLRNQLDEVIGVLQLVNARGPDGSITGFRPEIVSYIEALSSDAAVALDIRRLLKAQRDLLDSLIHMIAGAIDAKSPYTHGHCQRVPVVARMLAEAAHDTADGPFAQFNLSEDEWYELHLASWLHDCGKVTTPEYVVDKATKLETIYNRIHEIRMRFEVLWRDAQIEYYKDLLDGKQDEAQLRLRLDNRLAEIRDHFAFIAECNLGDNPMTDERIDRLQQIGSQTWLRHLDDKLGLSHLELQLRTEPDTGELPVEERLLADKPEHVIARDDGVSPFGKEPHGFRMEIPEHQYNRGELHNLSIARGTLTAEERFKINEHVIQTIRMLDRLPFPKELRRVTDWAGNHHEKLDGTGYPRRLSAAELSIPERIMAVADIFEALTATDRPYHAPKSLSKAITIMGFMCKDGHLCPDLFALFLESGVHHRYAEQYLQPEQIDDLDIAAVLESI